MQITSTLHKNLKILTIICILLKFYYTYRYKFILIIVSIATAAHIHDIYPQLIGMHLKWRYYFHIMLGFIPVTSGTAIVNGCDIRTDIAGVRESLGLCPQYNILYDSLTVEEHLYFFARVMAKMLPKM